MDFATILAFILFAVIAAFSPGPNNLMLAASGANFGVRRTLPHIFGITCGFLLLVVMGSYGLSSLFKLVPGLLNIAQFLSFFFILYLGYKIATAAPPEGIEGASKPLSFVSAMLFQIVNPKALVVITSSVTVYAGKAENLLLATAIITFIFAFVTIGSALLWAYTGSLLGRLLHDRKKLRIFNFSMAGLLIVSLVPIIFNL